MLTAAAVAQFLRGLLFHVSAIDIPSFAVAGFMFLVVSAAATLWPARRAARVDLIDALRGE